MNKWLSRTRNLVRVVSSAVLQRKPAVNCLQCNESGKIWHLFVDFRDERGRALAVRGLSQPELSKFWELVLGRIEPDVVIDIGANYGEFGLGVLHPDDRRVHLIEANPQLVKYLQKSIEAHPDRDRISLHEVLACGPDQEGGEAELFINTRWSGMSSAVLPQDDEVSTISVKRPCRMVSSLVGSTLNKRLVFKIDVEGYEGHVLAGMGSTIAEAGEYLGLIEFNRSNLEDAGSNPETIFNDLAKSGDVYLLKQVESPDGQVAIPDFEKVASLDEIPDGKEDIVVTNIERRKWLVSEEYGE